MLFIIIVFGVVVVVSSASAVYISFAFRFGKSNLPERYLGRILNHMSPKFATNALIASVWPRYKRALLC